MRMRPLFSIVSTVIVAFSFARVVEAADWPGILGANRDGVAADERLGRELTVVWRHPVGTGWAGPAAADGKVVVFHRLGNEAVAEALAADDGAVLWRFTYPTLYRDSFNFDNGPRAVPTIDVESNLVFLYGAEGMLHALRLDTGVKVWAVDTVAEYGSDQGFFGRGSSPLVAGDTLIALIGGENGAGIVGLDKRTGTLRWKAADHEVSYASPVLVTLEGRARVLALTRRALLLIDPADGRILAEQPFRASISASVLAATPLVSGGEVFLSACYGAGAGVHGFSEAGFEPRWFAEDVLENHYTNSVRVGDDLYGFHGRQDIPPPAELRCVGWADGAVRWSTALRGVGSVLTDGRRLLVVMETGDIHIADADPAGFQPLVSRQLLTMPIRAQPALSGGRLLVRDSEQLLSVSVAPAAP